MPRNGAGVYSKPSGTTPKAGDTVDPAAFNSLMDDFAAAHNDPALPNHDTTVTADWTFSGTIEATGTTNFPVVTRPEQYGAVGDGTTDDAPALQSAIDALEAAGGGVLHLSAKTYYCASGLTVQSDDIVIEGVGWASVLSTDADISLLSVGPANPLTVTSSQQRFGLRHVRLAQYGTDNTSSIGLDLFLTSSVTLDTVWVTHFYRDIQIAGGSTIILDNVQLSSGARMTGDVAGSAGLVCTTIQTSSQLGSQASDSNYYTAPSAVYVSNGQFRDSFNKSYTEYGILLEAIDNINITNTHIGVYQKMFGIVNDGTVSIANGLTVIANNLYLDGYYDGSTYHTDYGIYIDADTVNYNIHGLKLSNVDIDHCGINAVYVLARRGFDMKMSNFDIRLCNGNSIELDRCFRIHLSHGRIMDQSGGTALIHAAAGDIDLLSLNDLWIDANGVSYGVETAGTIDEVSMADVRVESATTDDYLLAHSGTTTNSVAGELGVGTPNPDGKFEVEDAGNLSANFTATGGDATVRIRSADGANDAALHFGDSTNPNLTRLTHDNATNDFSVYAGGADRITIDAFSGAVGINQTSPDESAAAHVGGKLVVEGDAYVADRAYVGRANAIQNSILTLEGNINGGQLVESSGGPAAIFIKDEKSNNAYISMNDGGTLYIGSMQDEVKVRDASGNETTISPHNWSWSPDGPSEEMAWSHYSRRNGKYIAADMTKALRMLEQLTGEQLIYIGTTDEDAA